MMMIMYDGYDEDDDDYDDDDGEMSAMMMIHSFSLLFSHPSICTLY